MRYKRIIDGGGTEYVLAYDNGWWLDQNYRTITAKERITTESGYEAYRLLMANATKLEPPEPTEIEFTIDGKLCKGTTNMTFYEWCNSAYNTIGCTLPKPNYVVMLNQKYLYSDTMHTLGVTGNVALTAGEAYVFDNYRGGND